MSILSLTLGSAGGNLNTLNLSLSGSLAVTGAGAKRSTPRACLNIAGGSLATTSLNITGGTTTVGFGGGLTASGRRERQRSGACCAPTAPAPSRPRRWP